MLFTSPIILFIVTTAAVIGYRFISVWNYTKFSIKLDPRPILIYDSMFCGSIVLLALYVLFLVPKYFIISSYLYYIDLDNIAVYFAVIIGIYLPYLLNYLFFTDEIKYLKLAMKSEGDSLYLKILDAIEEKYLVELTLKNGEVFIGFPPNSLSVRYKYVDLIPYAKGICNDEAKLANVTIKYWVVYEKITEKSVDPVAYSDHKISIKAEEILTVRRFDYQVYRYCKKGYF